MREPSITRSFGKDPGKDFHSKNKQIGGKWISLSQPLPSGEIALKPPIEGDRELGGGDTSRNALNQMGRKVNSFLKRKSILMAHRDFPVFLW